MTDVTHCPCGQPLHYVSTETRRLVEALIVELGWFVLVSTGRRTWLVPRHYIALHGLTAADLPTLAEKMDFTEVPFDS